MYHHYAEVDTIAACNYYGAMALYWSGILTYWHCHNWDNDNGINIWVTAEPYPPLGPDLGPTPGPTE